MSNFWQFRIQKSAKDDKVLRCGHDVGPFPGPFNEAGPICGFRQRRLSTASGGIESSTDNVHLMHSRLAMQDLGPHLTSPSLIGFSWLTYAAFD
jgi:hypothetical protein